MLCTYSPYTHPHDLAIRVEGDVMLGEKLLKAELVGDWVLAVKWLYTYVDPL